MQFLLDTHTFLWFISGDERLPSAARDLIADIENEIFLSVASLWEIAIKVSLKKLKLGAPFAELFPGQLIKNEINVLPIDFEALNLVANLPFHHRDPFDRLMIAQCLTQNMPIISRDSQFTAYQVNQIWQNPSD
ncbi:MAG: type II toxin-antitoxin system VapC family toxin [Anaerolineaceae bacterium]|nr:type II toxin-antitoxin system VapC family toxin [Anaerolineaceae bacterium]